MRSNTCRAYWHDYTCPCIYHITLLKSPLVEDFGRLAGDISVPIGQKGSSYIAASPIGKAIKNVLFHLSEIEPYARLYHYALMPDHLHMIIMITAKMGHDLGSVIAAFKVAVNNLVGNHKVFTDGFNDQILKRERSLDAIFRYLDTNARRLAIRKAHPEFFQKVVNLRINGQVFAAYGNFQLLFNPFKEQVVVHRRDTPQQRASNRARWLYTAANGGVLVSPFISEAEKAIRNEAIENGGRIILLSKISFGERFKPSGADFDLCAQGRLLILTPWQGQQLSSNITREQALSLNELSRKIATEEIAALR